MNAKWLGQYAFYIDPKFKSSEKELFRIVSQDLESLGANLLEEPSEVEHPKLPRVFLVNADSETNLR